MNNPCRLLGAGIVTLEERGRRSKAERRDPRGERQVGHESGQTRVVHSRVEIPHQENGIFVHIDLADLSGDQFRTLFPGNPDHGVSVRLLE